MKRREFSATAGMLGASALMLPGLGFAQAKAPQEGKDFRVLDKKVPSDAPAGKVEVIEFFWYSCPHCNAFEPKLNAWLKKLPPDVYFHRVPVAFRDDFVPQQRLYYTLEAMGKLDELHQKVFDAVHKDHKPTDKEDSILQFAQANGLDPRQVPGAVQLVLGVGQGAPRRSRSCMTCTRSKACLRSAWPAAGTPTARWPVAWTGPCRWSIT